MEQLDILSVLKDLAIIVVFAKVFGLIARKLKAPQVVGEIIAGLVVGPSVLGIVKLNQFLDICAGLGVVLLMFSAGLGTNLKQLLHTGVKALLIACAGVLVPLIGGTLLYMCFYGFSAIGTPQFFTAVFIGVIMTATSVSITVETLKELGKLKTELGTTILSAAIIDDVIGIMVLTFVIGFKNPDSNPGFVALSTLAFFALSVVLGFVIYKAFKIIDKRWPHTRRIPILALALCFGLSYVAEKVFGIADITGAYVAGIILSKLHDSDYIEQKMDINSYMIFGPIFFASIGLKGQRHAQGRRRHDDARRGGADRRPARTDRGHDRLAVFYLGDSADYRVEHFDADNLKAALRERRKKAGGLKIVYYYYRGWLG